MFVAALGLNALVRESLAAWNASELSRIFYRVGMSNDFFFSPNQRLKR